MTDMYWSRKPGKFLNKLTGAAVPNSSFTGTILEWYETIVEVMIDCAKVNQMGSAVEVRASDIMVTILQATVLFRPFVCGASQYSGYMKGHTFELDDVTHITPTMKIKKDTSLADGEIVLTSFDEQKTARVHIADMDLNE